VTPTLVAPWLLAVGPEGLVAVGPRKVVEIEVEGPRTARVALVDALATGAPANASTDKLGIEGSDVDELRALLADSGALADPDSSGDSAGPGLDGAAPLAEVLAATYSGGRPTSCYTAEELLLIPDACPLPIARRALHAFVGGMRPEARAVAYGHVAAHGDGVRGDRPTADLRALSRGLDPSLLHVVSLGGDASVSISPAELDELGAERPHRLGVIQEVTDPVPVELEGRRVVITRARYSTPNLRLPKESWAHGIGADGPHAELIARAEAAERYAIGRTQGVVLRRARQDELEGAVEPDTLSAPNRRQAAVFPAPEIAERLWVAARTTDTARRWVPADAVLVPLQDPARPDPWLVASSSGVAAHVTTDEATPRALRELIERDALMWRWIQRVPPARLAEAALSDEARHRLAALRRRGWEVDLVDLTLDLLPVAMCAMRRPGQLGLGMGCARSTIHATERALEECLMITWMGKDRGVEPINDPTVVRAPSDHLALHHDPEHAATHAFLFECHDEVDPRDLPTPEEPLPELVRPIGETLLVEHAVPQVRPFRVIRALVPGLVPISFGYDREPLGLPRLARPITTRVGRTIGDHLDLSSAGPILPHPFP
jgi:thiazole/oxazole-forming peptide maturase SagD family component